DESVTGHSQVFDGNAAMPLPSEALYGEAEVLPALVDTMQRYKMPARYLHDLISGAEMSNLRAPPRILLPRCRHGWPHLYARVWLPRRARTGFGRKAWPGLSADEHHSRCSRGLQTRPCVSPGRRSPALRGFTG